MTVKLNNYTATVVLSPTVPDYIIRGYSVLVMKKFQTTLPTGQNIFTVANEDLEIKDLQALWLYTFRIKLSNPLRYSELSVLTIDKGNSFVED